MEKVMATGIPLAKWARQNDPGDHKFKQYYWDQINFVANKIGLLFFDDRLTINGLGLRIKVIESHVAKSLRLPVFFLDFKDIFGVEFILANNLLGWRVSVNSVIPLTVDFYDIVDTRNKNHLIFDAGYSEDMVYESHEDNKYRFTFNCSDSFDLYVALTIIRSHLIHTNNFIPKKAG